MSKSQSVMTEEDYDACVVAYGVDVALWPEADRVRAVAFMRSPQGLNAISLDNAFTDYRSKERADEMTAETNTADFLMRLQAIPDQYPKQASSNQVKASTQWFGQKLAAFVDGLIEPGRLWSPLGLATQGFAVALLMGVGMLVGAQQGTETFTDYDISAGLFEENTADYSIDG